LNCANTLPSKGLSRQGSCPQLPEPRSPPHAVKGLPRTAHNAPQKQLPARGLPRPSPSLQPVWQRSSTPPLPSLPATHSTSLSGRPATNLKSAGRTAGATHRSGLASFSGSFSLCPSAFGKWTTEARWAGAKQAKSFSASYGQKWCVDAPKRAFTCGWLDSPIAHPLCERLPKMLAWRVVGAFAAASRACAAKLREDLSTASSKFRRCAVCSQFFDYANSWCECRFHPGEEKVHMVVEGPGSGMLDVYWTCCGRGAAYAVGFGLPCARAEIPGCCTRKHRASDSDL